MSVHTACVYLTMDILYHIQKNITTPDNSKVSTSTSKHIVKTFNSWPARTTLHLFLSFIYIELILVLWLWRNMGNWIISYPIFYFSLLWTCFICCSWPLFLVRKKLLCDFAKTSEKDIFYFSILVFFLFAKYIILYIHGYVGIKAPQKTLYGKHSHFRKEITSRKGQCWLLFALQLVPY